MAKDPTELSTLEQRVMLALMHLHPNGYGVSIQLEIEKLIGKNISVGSIYDCLDRLKSRSFVKPRLGEVIPERGGRKKVYFELTALGQRVIRTNLVEIRRMSDGVIDGALA